MTSPSWEFDEHFSSVLEEDEHYKDSHEKYVDEEEEELYYQVYFDRTEESKHEDYSVFKVEEVSKEDVEVNGSKEKNKYGEVTEAQYMNGKKIKVSKISNALKSAGMSILELKKILNQNSDDSERTSGSSISFEDSSGCESDDEGDSSSHSDSNHNFETSQMQVNFEGLDGPADQLLGGILKDMPESSSSWKVDLPNYMVSKIKCSNCNQQGHTSFSCSSPRKKPRCNLCAREGHQMNKCQEQVCFRCHQQGHPTKQCGAGSLKDLKCLRCFVRGHLIRACPDTWRQYHLTTTANHNDYTTRGATMPTLSKQHCFNCAREGHFGHTCKDRRMNYSHSIASPFIFKYDFQLQRHHHTTPFHRNYKQHPGFSTFGGGGGSSRKHLQYDNALFLLEASPHHHQATNHHFATTKNCMNFTNASNKDYDNDNIYYTDDDDNYYDNFTNSSTSKNKKNKLNNNEKNNEGSSFKGSKERRVGREGGRSNKRPSHMQQQQQGFSADFETIHFHPHSKTYPHHHQTPQRYGLRRSKSDESFNDNADMPFLHGATPTTRHNSSAANNKKKAKNIESLKHNTKNNSNNNNNSSYHFYDFSSNGFRNTLHYHHKKNDSYGDRAFGSRNGGGSGRVGSRGMGRVGGSGSGRGSRVLGRGKGLGAGGLQEDFPRTFPSDIDQRFPRNMRSGHKRTGC